MLSEILRSAIFQRGLASLDSVSLRLKGTAYAAASLVAVSFFSGTVFSVLVEISCPAKATPLSGLGGAESLPLGHVFGSLVFKGAPFVAVWFFYVLLAKFPFKFDSSTSISTVFGELGSETPKDERFELEGWPTQEAPCPEAQSNEILPPWGAFFLLALFNHKKVQEEQLTHLKNQAAEVERELGRRTAIDFWWKQAVQEVVKSGYFIWFILGAVGFCSLVQIYWWLGK